MGSGTEPTVEFSQLVIDSSAFDRLSVARLEEVAARAALLVSPLSLYEIVCHLDEPKRAGEALEKRRPVRASRLAKCRLLQALDDPLAEQGPFAPVGQWIDEIASGTAGPDVTVEAERALAESRRDHAKASIEFARKLVARLGLEHALSLSGMEFVRVASDGVGEAAKRYQALCGDEPALEGELFSVGYPFAGYRLARAQAALWQLKRDGELGVDPLDMEDAHLCLLLNLLEPRALVTARAGAREALNRALSQLGAASAEAGTEVVARTRAIDADELH